MDSATVAPSQKVTLSTLVRTTCETAGFIRLLNLNLDTALAKTANNSKAVILGYYIATTPTSEQIKLYQLIRSAYDGMRWSEIDSLSVSTLISYYMLKMGAKGFAFDMSRNEKGDFIVICHKIGEPTNPELVGINANLTYAFLLSVYNYVHNCSNTTL
jgi:hypothetical protein